MLFKKALTANEKFKRDFKTFLDGHLGACTDAKEVDFIAGTLYAASLALKKRKDPEAQKASKNLLRKE